MGYHVKVEELHMVLQTIRAQIEQWQEQLNQVQSELSLLQNTVAIQGQTGESIRSYVSEVQNVVLEAIQQALTEYDMKITLYVNGYNGVDGSENAELMQERFEHQQQLLTQEMRSFQSLSEEIIATITDVEDIISVSSPIGNIVTDSFTQMGTFLQELNTKVGEYEESHKADSQSVENMLSTIDTIITGRTGAGVNASNYVPGSYVMNPAYSTLKNQMGTSAKYAESYLEMYKDALLREENIKKEVVFETTEIDDKLLDELMKAFGNKALPLLENGLKENESIELLKDGVRFHLNKVGNKTYLQLGGTITSSMTRKELQLYLKNTLKEVDWSKYDVKQLTRNGLNIQSNNFKKINYDNLDSYLDAVRQGESAVGMATKAAFKGNINVFDDFSVAKFKQADTLAKGGRILGAFGTIMNVAENVQENLFEDGKLALTADNIQDTITDTGVDILAGAGSAAAGAAIGSLFLPPLGTAVGAVAGMAIDSVFNMDLWDVDHDGEKDSLVDMAKIGVNQVCDWVGGLF
ncbi:MAG: T7SS effector LXG polymorphic toxin [Hespellia sp.]|nr:T7SS effector LXG polymorphic toxin [Hespellia sp.]